MSEALEAEVERRAKIDAGWKRYGPEDQKWCREKYREIMNEDYPADDTGTDDLACMIGRRLAEIMSTVTTVSQCECCYISRALDYEIVKRCKDDPAPVLAAFKAGKLD